MISSTRLNISSIYIKSNLRSRAGLVGRARRSSPEHASANVGRCLLLDLTYGKPHLAYMVLVHFDAATRQISSASFARQAFGVATVELRRCAVTVQTCPN